MTSSQAADPGRPALKLFGYFRSSSSYRVRIALEHKCIPFESVAVSVRAGEQRSEPHLARNPLGQVPVLEIQQGGNSVCVAQSLAIIEYLEEAFPEHPLLPREPIVRARCRELAEIINSGTQPLQ